LKSIKWQTTIAPLCLM